MSSRRWMCLVPAAVVACLAPKYEVVDSFGDDGESGESAGAAGGASGTSAGGNPTGGKSGGGGSGGDVTPTGGVGGDDPMTGGTGSGAGGDSNGGTTSTGGEGGTAPTGGTSSKGGAAGSGVGGMTGVGGMISVGGMTGVGGGAAGRGGMTGVGGMVSVGGMAGVGGTTGKGGMASVGGTTGVGGSAAGRGGTGTGGTGGVNGNVLFQDDFESGVDGWTFVPEAPWSITTDGSRVLLALGPANGSTSLASAGDITWTNVRADARVKVTSFIGSSTGYYAGLCVRVLDENNRACIALRADGRGAIRAMINGSSQTGPSAGTYATNTWYNLRIEANGMTITAYVNGMFHSEFPNFTSPSSGGVGLVAIGANAAFDDVVVSAL